MYEVELRVQYARKVTVVAPDEDAAIDEVVHHEAVLVGVTPGSSGLDIQYYGIREITKAEIEG